MQAADLARIVEGAQHALDEMEDRHNTKQQNVAEATSALGEFTQRSLHVIGGYDSVQKGNKDNLGLLLISAAFLQDISTVKAVLALQKDVGVFGPLCASIVSGMGYAETVTLVLSAHLEWFTSSYFENFGYPYPFTSAACNEHVDVVKLLLPTTPNFVLNRVATLVVGVPMPPLLVCLARMNLVSIIKLLLRRKPALELRDDTQNTALAAACFEGHFDSACLLLKAGACVNVEGVMGATPLQMAAANGNLQLVFCLLKNGADANHNSNSLLGVPLVLASRASPMNPQSKEVRDYDSIVRLLLMKGAELDIRNNLSQETALICACEYGQQSIAKQLVLAGADINLRDKRGCSAANLWSDLVTFKNSFEKATTLKLLRSLESRKRDALCEMLEAPSQMAKVVATPKPAPTKPKGISRKLNAKQKPKKTKKQKNGAPKREVGDIVAEEVPVEPELMEIPVVMLEDVELTVGSSCEQRRDEPAVVESTAPTPSVVQSFDFPCETSLQRFPITASGLPAGLYFVCLVPSELNDMVNVKPSLTKIWTAIQSGRLLLPKSKDKVGIKVLSMKERAKLKEGQFCEATHKVKPNKEDVRVYLKSILQEKPEGGHEILLMLIGPCFKAPLV